MDVESFSALKNNLAKVAGIVLVIAFLEDAVSSADKLQVMYSGLAIAAVIMAVGAWQYMESRSG
jgi:hypothetical protein